MANMQHYLRNHHSANLSFSTLKKMIQRRESSVSDSNACSISLLETHIESPLDATEIIFFASYCIRLDKFITFLAFR